MKMKIQLKRLELGMEMMRNFLMPVMSQTENQDKKKVAR
jgi:hypothetical protein